MSFFLLLLGNADSYFYFFLSVNLFSTLKAAGERVPRESLTAMSHEAMYQLALAVPDESLRGFYSDVSKATTSYLEFV